MSSHIVLAIDSLVGRGAEKVVSTLSAALVDKGHAVSLIIYEDVIEYPLDPRVRLFRLDPEPRRGARMFESFTHRRNAEKFMRIVREAEASAGPASVIVSNLPRMDKILSYVDDIRIYFAIHNTLSIQNGFHKKPWYRHISRILHTKSVYDGKQIIAVSDGVGVDLVNAMKVRPRSLCTIYNPVDLDTTIALAQEAMPLPADDYIVHVGAYTIRQKRQDLIVKAFARSGLTCKLVFIGKGRDEDEIRRIAQAEGVGDRVIVAGFRPNPYPWMKAARFLVVGSDYEGFGMVIVEALALGVPVISTDCQSGPREILSGTMSQGLVPVGDADAMARKMQAYYATPAPIDRDSLARFTTAAVTERYLSLAKT